MYTKYFDLNRAFDLEESCLEFQSWLKSSPIANIIHKTIDMLVSFIFFNLFLDCYWFLLS